MLLPLLRSIPDLVRIVADPGRLDAVFRVSRRIATPQELIPMLECMASTDHGRQLLEQRFRLPPLNFEALRAHAPGTLGHAISAYFERNELDPADIPALEAATECEFVMAHLYETHDLWHVATGFGTDVAGELGLQAFYAAQLPTKFAWVLFAAGFLNTAARAFDDRARRMESIARGWAMGRRARLLAGIRWPDFYDVPLSDFRQSFGLTPEESVGGTPHLQIAA